MSRCSPSPHAFLDSSDPDQAAAEEAIKGLQGIVVRSYTFDQDAAYKPSDLDGVRSQLAAPGWSTLWWKREAKKTTPTSRFT